MTTSDLAGLLPELEVVRKDFPILERTLAGGVPLVYLDSANTSQKPQVVIDAMVDHLERHNANIARAMHQLGAESTAAFEEARDKVAAFLSARSRNEVDLHQERLRGAQPAPHCLARTSDLVSRRRGRHHRDGAPLQHRAVAAGYQRTGASCAGSASPTTVSWTCATSTS